MRSHCQCPSLCTDGEDRTSLEHIGTPKRHVFCTTHTVDQLVFKRNFRCDFEVLLSVESDQQPLLTIETNTVVAESGED